MRGDILKPLIDVPAQQGLAALWGRVQPQPPPRRPVQPERHGDIQCGGGAELRAAPTLHRVSGRGRDIPDIDRGQGEILWPTLIFQQGDHAEGKIVGGKGELEKAGAADHADGEGQDRNLPKPVPVAIRTRGIGPDERRVNKRLPTACPEGRPQGRPDFPDKHGNEMSRGRREAFYKRRQRTDPMGDLKCLFRRSRLSEDVKRNGNMGG